jgi:hypothetical protein
VQAAAQGAIFWSMSSGATSAARLDRRIMALFCLVLGCSEARTSADLGGGGHAGAAPIADGATEIGAEAEPHDASGLDADGSDATGEASADVVVTGPCGQTPLERALISAASEATRSAAEARLELARACSGVATKLDFKPAWKCCEPPSDSVLISTCQLASHAFRTELTIAPGTEVAIPPLPCTPGVAALACGAACPGAECGVLCAALASTEATCPAPWASVLSPSARLRDAVIANGPALVRIHTWLSGTREIRAPHLVTEDAAARMAGVRRECTQRVGELARASVSFDTARSSSAEVLVYMGVPLGR